MKNTIYSISIALKMFILSICLLNFTACSVKAKIHDTIEKTRTTKALDSTYDARTSATLKSTPEHTTVHSEVETKDSLNIKNGKEVE